MAAPRQITETEFFLVYYDIFVRNAFGNYRDVLREVGSHLMALTNSACRAKSGYTTTTKAATPGLPPFATTTGIAPLRPRQQPRVSHWCRTRVASLRHDNNQECHTGAARGSPPFVHDNNQESNQRPGRSHICASLHNNNNQERVSNGPVVRMYARAARARSRTRRRWRTT